MSLETLQVREIPHKDAYPLLLHTHYAARIPSISYSYGLFTDDTLLGVCTYGCPCSPNLRRGLCGREWAKHVLELNRLCLVDNKHNQASFLVGATLRLLPRPRIIISFADTAQQHLGIVYQATNFLYCGLSAKRTDWQITGREHLHGMTVGDEFRGQPNRAAKMRKKYGDAFSLVPRPRKHRYVYFLGSKREKKEFRRLLRYPVMSYPKNNCKTCRNNS